MRKQKVKKFEVRAENYPPISVSAAKYSMVIEVNGKMVPATWSFTDPDGEVVATFEYGRVVYIITLPAE